MCAFDRLAPVPPGRPPSQAKIREIAERLVDGFPQSEIARALKITPSTLSRRIVVMRTKLAEHTGDPGWLDWRKHPPVQVARAWLALPGSQS